MHQFKPSRAVCVVRRCANGARCRKGSLVVWCAFLMVVLLGMVGLVLDSGLMLAGFRHAQNASDAAALAAAYAKLRGESDATAIASGTTFVTDGDHNALPDPNVTINIPPSSGPYAGNSSYVEALVSSSAPTFFIHVLPGVERGHTVNARAVAGYELVSAGKGVMALDPDARPGLKISGQATLQVNGDVYVNSEGGGVDENGEPTIVDEGQTATTVNNNGSLLAENVDIVGGVNLNGLDNILNIEEGGEQPLHANQLPASDPLINLPTPTVANGVINVDRGAPEATGEGLVLNNPNDDAGSPNYIETDPVTGVQTMVLQPGIYESIKITGGYVRFVPGIYVLQPTASTAFTLEIIGGEVEANGIMFYNTGDNYDPVSGSPDASDYLNYQLPAPDGAHFGNVKINDSVHMSGLDTSLYNYGTAPPDIASFDGLLYYQRRLSDARVQIEGDSADAEITGSFYAKSGELTIDGQGTYNGSFIVGSLKAEGQATMIINPDEDSLPKTLQVFLVE